jgi:hypothetical protein
MAKRAHGTEDRPAIETPLAVVVLHAGHLVASAELVAWSNARVGKQQRINGVAR